MQVTSTEASVQTTRTDFNHAIIKAPGNGTICISIHKREAMLLLAKLCCTPLLQITIFLLVSDKEVYRFIHLKDR